MKQNYALYGNNENRNFSPTRELGIIQLFGRIFKMAKGATSSHNTVKFFAIRPAVIVTSRDGFKTKLDKFMMDVFQ